MRRNAYKGMNGAAGCRGYDVAGLALAIFLAALLGCQPSEPFYLRHVDRDLSHYNAVANTIEYPDVETNRLTDVSGANRPFSLTNNEPRQIWNLALEQAVQIALTNNRVMRTIGGQVQGPPDFLLRNPQLVPTVYDPALAESNPNTGVEAALSAFDTRFNASLMWQRVDSPNNWYRFDGLGLVLPFEDREDIGAFNATLSKTTATGAEFSISHDVDYAKTNLFNNVLTGYPADWNVKLTAEMRQPLLQGGGIDFNRIAGPGARVGQYNGVVLARINTDIALADFEMGVRNLVSDVETAYWELYFAYRGFDAQLAGRESALSSWRKIASLARIGARGGEAEREAQAREQYFTFRSTAERALNSLYVTEAKLRYLMGIAATDGRLIRPQDDPATAKIVFDWNDVLNEGLVRSVELREQKWVVKRRELELVAAKNFLLPRLDLLAQYQWLGMGNELDGSGTLDSNTFTQPPGTQPPDTNAYRTLTSGQFQQWQLGFQLSMPLGFRREMAGVRNAELQLTKERAKLQEQELELSHQLAFAIRDLEANYVLSETNFNRRIAAQHEVEAVSRAYENDTVTIDRVLDAQRSLAAAESEYYRSLVDYNRSISQVHFRKGSLLEYNGVYLAEGPWPAKACFDARRRARAREAGLHFDYGFSKPDVISRGPMNQQMDSDGTPPAAPANAAPPAPAGELLPPPNVPVPPGPMPPPPTPAAPAPPVPPAAQAPAAGQPQAPESIPVDAQGTAAARLPATTDERMGNSRVDDVSWLNPVRDEAGAGPSSADPVARPWADRPAVEQQMPAPQQAMPMPPQPAMQLPIREAGVPVPPGQPLTQLPAQQPAVQPPLPPPASGTDAEANPLREVAERAAGEGQGLRE
jgi:outer membrane protein TolC